MEEIILEVQQREEVGKNKVNAMRKTGFIPAIVYGEGKKAVAVKVNRSMFIHLLHSQHSENIIINLKIEDESKKQKGATVIVKEMQHDPVTDDILHIDFNQISMTKEITVKVPILAKGEPIGVKQEDGSLEHNIWELEVECLPTQIPENIEVNVSELNIGDSIQVKDLTIPPGVKVKQELEAVVLSVIPPKKVEEVVAPEGEEGAEAEPTEPEVLKEKKEAPEGEAKEAPEGKKQDKGEKKA
ncbi:50S ribosomal protein L25 [Candidatus Omnitrophota bacterium]